MMTDRELVKQIIRISQPDSSEGLLGDVIYRRPYTYVRVGYPIPNSTVYGYGFSKVCWPDRYDKERGFEIALAKPAQDAVSELSLVRKTTESGVNWPQGEAIYDDIPF